MADSLSETIKKLWYERWLLGLRTLNFDFNINEVFNEDDIKHVNDVLIYTAKKLNHNYLRIVRVNENVKITYRRY